MSRIRRQSLWDLLGHASQRRASDSFAQTVAQRATRVRQQEGHPFLAPLAALGAAAALAAVMAAVFALRTTPAPPVAHEAATPSSRNVAAEGRSEESFPSEPATAEFQEIVLMNELLAVNDPEQLDDEALAELLF